MKGGGVLAIFDHNFIKKDVFTQCYHLKRKGKIFFCQDWFTGFFILRLEKVNNKTVVFFCENSIRFAVFLQYLISFQRDCLKFIY